MNNESYEIVRTRQFKKDFKKFKENKKVHIKFQKVVSTLAKKEKLAEKYKDHQLKGKLKNCRECHLFPDILLVYEIENNLLVLSLIRIGSHCEIFE